VARYALTVALAAVAFAGVVLALAVVLAVIG
jgi:hypothetical protein